MKLTVDMMRICRVTVPGSCGELVQGSIDGTNFLITCPVSVYSTVSIQTAAVAYPLPMSQRKVAEAVRRTWEYLAVDVDGYQLTVSSVLPRGKGMASSSADIAAACQAAALLVGRRLSVAEVADLALAIEPTDAVFYPGITMFDHVQGTIRHSLGQPPALSIMVFDDGGEVDTLHFNQRSDLACLNQKKEPQIREAVELVRQGIQEQRVDWLGAGATLSARANQDILYKKHLETMIAIGEQYGAVGVNVAHSGTVTGLLFAGESDFDQQACRLAVEKQCPELSYLQTVSLVSGGFYE